MLETPVAFFVFNRPDTTRKVLAEIAKAKPKKLLLVADGPRPNRTGEADLCDEVRSIINLIDWDCDILRNYSDINMGCKHRVSSGLNWVFEQCEDAIILEDDCLPDQSFFVYCEELINRYRNTNTIMSINGINVNPIHVGMKHSYYFSKYVHVWGWATWRRAWKHYDVRMSDWPRLKQLNWLKATVKNENAATYWERIFNMCYEGTIDTWDYQWLFACWLNDGLAITPNFNLVSNIGFREDATHTTNDNYNVSNLPRYRIALPLVHPDKFYADSEADDRLFIRYFMKEIQNRSLVRRILGKARQLFNS